KEVSQKITTIKRRTSEKAIQKKNHLFGSEKVSIPTIITTQKPNKALSQNEKSTQPYVDYIVNMPTTTPAFTNEQYWFEMRKSTGGSRNMLELSKLGQTVKGLVAGTPYEYTDPNRMYGGVKFFEIDPEDTSREKNITINYLGKDYFPSTIK